MAAVEGAHLSVAADLQEQYRDELLGHRVVGVPAARRVFGASAFAQVPGERPLQAP
jgi:hypothetical protein